MMQARKLTHVALLLAFALVIHALEGLLPPLGIPGAKLGLANVITLLTFVLYGFRTAFFLATVRPVLGSILIGNILGIGFLLSLSGAVVSMLVMAVGMALWRRGTISLVTVSIMGAVAHNTAQVAVAGVLLENINLLKVYLPILLILAVPTGFFTGLVVVYSKKALAGIVKPE